MSESQTAINDMMSGEGDNHLCTESNVRVATIAKMQLLVGDGPTNESDRHMHGLMMSEIVQKKPDHGCQWKKEGHPFAIRREQVPTKLMDRRAKIEYQTGRSGVANTPPWAKRISSEDRAKTSHFVGRQWNRV